MLQNFLIALSILTGVSLWLGLINLKKGRSRAKGFIVSGWAIFLATQLLSLSSTFGLVPQNDLTLAIWQVGLLLFLFFLFVTMLCNHLSPASEIKQAKSSAILRDNQNDTDVDASVKLQKIIARIAHDFRTPLAVIDSTLQSLVMIEHHNDPQRLSRYDRIRRATVQLNDMLARSFATGTEYNDQNKHAPSSHKLVLRWHDTDAPEHIYLCGVATKLEVALDLIFIQCGSFSLLDQSLYMDIRLINPDSHTACVEIIFSIQEAQLSKTDLSSIGFENIAWRDDLNEVPIDDASLPCSHKLIRYFGGQLLKKRSSINSVIYKIILPTATYDN